MIRYFCDKCGKELFDRASMSIVTIEPPGDDIETRSYVLCHDCEGGFNKWINKVDDFVRYAPQPDLETLHIPDACQSCSNHPSNGGSGICHCTLGTPQVKC